MGSAAMERTTLLLNHVIAAEPAATARLRPHFGRSVEVLWTGWPSLLPAPPRMAWRITPAGLLEWCVDALAEPADLRVSLDGSNPLRLAGQLAVGERPSVGIEGDSGLAADVNWLIDHLRWDIEDDLAGVIGKGPAHQVAAVGSWVAKGFREAAQTIQKVVQRSGGSDPR